VLRAAASLLRSLLGRNWSSSSELVLERYRHLFGNTYWHDSRDDSYKPFPPLDLERFRNVQREGDVWIVKCDPLAGYNVRARVAADGSWVDLEHVGYAAR